MAHNDAEVFWEKEHPAQHATRVVTQPDGLIVTSVCPQCGGDSDWPISLVRPGPSQSGASPQSITPAGSIPADSFVVCACGFPHAGRPPTADETGCGGYWPVLDPP